MVLDTVVIVGDEAAVVIVDVTVDGRRWLIITCTSFCRSTCQQVRADLCVDGCCEMPG